MKKITLLTTVLMISALINVYGQCDPINVFPFTENFEDNSPTRNCWTQQQVLGNNSWTFATGTQNGSPGFAYEGDYHARFTDDGNGEVTKLISPVFNLSAYSSPCILSFYYAQASWSGDQNILKVYFRTGPAAPWILLFTDNANRPVWTYKTLELPAPSATYQIAFEGTDNYGYANMLDLVSVLPPCAPVSSFPFTETFENSSPTRYCWSQEVISGNKSWSFETGTIDGTLQNAHSGELNACFTNSWGMNYVTRLISPVFDLSTGTMPYTLSFYYAQEENDGNQNYLNVYYRPGPAAGWILLFSDSTNRPGWTLATMSLPSVSASYQLAFEGSANGGYANVIDKVMISDCSIPQMIQFSDITSNSAGLSWMPGGFEYQWDLKISPAGYNPDTEGTLTAGLTLTTHSFINLNWGTLYDVYIRPVCTPGMQNPWIGPYRFNTQYNLPYFEDFDEIGLTPLPPGWNRITLTQISWHNPTVDLSAPGYSEPYCVELDDCVDYKKSAVSDETQVEEVILISPEMPVALNLLRVSLMGRWGANPENCGIPQLAVGTMTDPLAYNTFTEIQILDLSNAWEEYTVNLNNYAGSDHYIAFRLLFSDFGFGRVQLDDILIEYLPTCLEPTDLQANTASETEITINWMPGQNESSWDVMYGPPGFIQGTLIQDVTTNPFNITGLQSGAMYDIYVRANCGGGDLSAWTGPLTANTLCGPVSAPVSENFDNTDENMLPNCWSAIATLPSAVLTVTDMNTSEPHALMMLNDPAAQDTVYFVTPMLADPINTLMISFNAFAYDWGNTFTLGTLSDPTDPSTFTPVYDFLQIPEYTEWAWDFYDYTRSDTYIAFRLAEDAVILLDDIVIDVPFVCQMPESVSIQSVEPNTVTVSWVAVNQETSWNVIFGAPGFDPYAEGTLLEGITDNPFTLSDLGEGETYDIYISAICSNGDWSEWSGPVTVTTGCVAQNLPWFEDFSLVSVGSLPGCMFVDDGNTDGQTWTTGTDATGNQAITLIPAVGQQSQDDWFFSPPFDLQAGHTYVISFDYMADPANPNNQIAVYNGPTANPAGMNQNSLFSTSVSNPVYQTASFTFMPGANGIQVFGWHCTSGSPQSTLFIDNISITETVLVNCPPAMSLCSGSFPIVLSGGSPSGGVYSGPGVSLSPNQEFIFDPALLSPGGYTVTYSYTTQFGSNSCDFDINIQEIPEVICPDDLSVSTNVAPFQLTGGSPSGGTYFGQSIVNNMFYPAMATIGSNTAGYMYTDPITQCQGFCTFTINMNEAVNLICPPDFSLCVGASSVILSGGSPAGGVYSGTGVYQGQNQEYIFDPSLLSPGNYTITYTYTTQFGVYTCTFIATVYALPTVTCPTDMTAAATAAPFQLSGALPSGGTYSGQAVVNNMFHPMMAGIGPNNVLYTYTDPITTCQSNCEFTVNITEVVNMICPPDFSLCVGASSVILSGASPAGGVYSGAGVYQGQNQEYRFDPALVSPGNHTITYTYTTQFGVYTCTFIATVNALPTVTCPTDINFCWGNPPLTLSGGIPAGGIYSGPGVSGTTFDPNSAGLGSHVITYTYTNANNCSTSCEFSINVINGQLLSVTMVADTLNACMGDNVTFQAVTQNAGQNPLIQWYVNNQLQATTGQTLTISPQLSSNVYCVVNSFEPCTLGNPATSDTLTVNVFPSLNPAISISADDDTICEGTLVTYHVAMVADTGSAPVFQWQVNGMNVGTNSQSYAYIPGNADLVKCLLIVNEPCVSQNPVISNIISTVIIPTPVVQLSLPIDTLCINWDPVTLSGGIPVGGVYSGNGVSNLLFNPLAAGTGVHTIAYTWTDLWGCSDSTTAPIYVDLCTDVYTNLPSETLVLYPNPANNIMFIRNTDMNDYSFEIVDLQGRQHAGNLIAQEKEEICLDVSGLPQGMYFVRINGIWLKFNIIH